MNKPGKGKAPLPTRQQILDFLAQHPGKAGKREIARAFALDVPGRIWLKREMKALAADGLAVKSRGRRLIPAGTLPEVAPLDITGRDIDGELMAQPVDWPGTTPSPRIILAPTARGQPALGIGERVLARLSPAGDGSFQARVIRRLSDAPERVIGVFRLLGGEGRIKPADKRERHEIAVPLAQCGGAQPGEVVVAERLPKRAFGLGQARVVERLGPLGDPRSLSLMAAQAHGIPSHFSAEVLDEAAAAKPTRLGSRLDLRTLPLVTIDPEDARDHDDAVYAEADADPNNPGGFRVVVAIADVSWYVRPGSRLDHEARRRGNSVYFPDQVVPMLPEALSADLCSLIAGKSRPCLVAEMWFDREGNKRRHCFHRALMRSAASLTYEAVQKAADGHPDPALAPLMDRVITPLYRAYDALARARDARGPLAIELPERKVRIGADGYIAGIAPRERLVAHRLIEEFMIAANVCAAETLEEMKEPCLYRVHDEPALERLDQLRDFLATLDLRLARGQALRPAIFNHILAKAAGTPRELLVNEVVLRSQSQACYSPENRGHFGLNLRRYAHFTSPIRRYADLLVHRALVSGGRLGAGGLSPEDRAQFAATAELISAAERRAMLAEREALDRFTAAYMASHIGARFWGRISGVTRFGLFVKLEDSGADGLVPISTLGDDFYQHDERRHALVGRRFHREFQLGTPIEVKLAEADVVTGGIRFEILDAAGTPATARRGGRSMAKPPPRGRKRH